MAPPRFFALFAWLELLLHVPVSFWAVAALWPRPRSPQLGGAALVALLAYGLETALTTLTCMWEAAGWDDALVAPAEKRVLIGGLYGGYFAVGQSFPVFSFLCPFPSFPRKALCVLLPKTEWRDHRRLTESAMLPAVLMTVDMWLRLCKRLEAADAAVARKKGL